MMTLCFIFALMTAGVLGLLLSPLRYGQATASQVSFDLAVYRDQLAEIDKDIERGLLSSAEAEAARTEIHRRMLAADATAGATSQSGSARSRFALALLVIVILPLGAALTYAALGNPNLPGRPYAERRHDPDFILTEEAEHVEAALALEPDAGEYKRLGDVWFVLHRYDKAAAAYGKSADLDGANTAIWSSRGEATVLANEGTVTPDAHEAFAEAAKRDARDPRARFYLALWDAQNGNPQHAAEAWRALEKDSPPDAPWMPMLRKQIAQTGSKNAEKNPPANAAKAQ
jgi:cytochrome c-type biogenesis protein CcmH